MACHLFSILPYSIFPIWTVECLLMFLYCSFKWFYNIVGFLGGEKTTYFRLIVIDVKKLTLPLAR